MKKSEAQKAIDELNNFLDDSHWEELAKRWEAMLEKWQKEYVNGKAQKNRKD